MPELKGADVQEVGALPERLRQILLERRLASRDLSNSASLAPLLTVTVPVA